MTGPRRELATRRAGWAITLARWLAMSGVRPNAVSIAGIGFAALSGIAFAISSDLGREARAAVLFAAAAAIQLRLLCNLLDGMLAVEEGLKSKTGDIYNEVPDRIADVLILLGAGYAGRDLPYGVTLGWAAALAAVLTAYIRVFGGSIGAGQHFIGPMAKQHRMFTLTVTTLAAVGESLAGAPARAIRIGLTVIVAGLDRYRDPPDRAHRRRGQGAMIAAALSAGARLLCGASVRWHCDPTETKQRIYYGNHSSHLDFIMIWSALPPRLRHSARPVAGRDYWERGAVRRYLAGRVFRSVLIERGQSASAGGSGEIAASARAAIEHMAREMGDRYSLIVFPEGTRSMDGEVGPFKSGLYHLSQLCPDVELVPVYLENLNRILPKGESLPVPMMSRVTFGPALSLSNRDDKVEFLLKARAALMQLKDAR